jgi:GntR family transcriptional regulator
MKWNFQIDGHSHTPIFEQICREIERLIVIGQLKEGDFIPSVREFAVSHQVNPNTVAKAYQELQRSGMVDSQRGKGLCVCRVDDKVLNKKRREKLSAKIHELIQLARALGFQRSELIQMMNKEF